MEVSSKTTRILKGLKIVAWLAFIGFMIQAGAMLVSSLIAIGNEESARDFYNGVDLSGLYAYSRTHYLTFVLILVTVSALKSYVWFLVIRVLSKINLENPFSMDMIRQLEKISYVLAGTWIMIVIGNIHSNFVHYETGVFYGEKATGAFLFMAGLVFVITQVFKKGVEMQIENELTV